MIPVDGVRRDDMAPHAIEQKRHDLLTFLERALVPYPAVKGVVAVGSIAAGNARPDSDIDAVVFFDPYDPHIVPAEFRWRPSDGSFHSIFSDVEGIEFDLVRVDMARWSAEGFLPEEGQLAELAAGWIAFDRDGSVARLVERLTAYPEELRQARIDEAITWLDQHLGEDGPEVRWDSLGPLLAHDRLDAAYHYLAQALFAYNRRWRSWRNREMTGLLALPWLPEEFPDRALLAIGAPSLDFAGYMARVETLLGLFDDLLTRLVEDGLYTEDPIGEAFIRGAEEPGRAWNMDAWNAAHKQLVARYQPSDGGSA